jgi:prevent-host-death family protein
MSVVTIRDLGRNPSMVVDDVATTGRPALVTKNGRPVAALVRIDQVGMEDWVLAATADPEIGTHLELDLDHLIHAAAQRPRPRNLVIDDLTDAESERFWAVLERI